MEIRRPEGVTGNIPAGPEPEVISQWYMRVNRLRCKYGINARVGVIDGRGVLCNEFGQVVL